MNSADPNEVVARALCLAAEDSIELCTPERIAEFARAEKELEEFFLSPQRTALSRHAALPLRKISAPAR